MTRAPSFQRKLESSKKKISHRYGDALDSSLRWNDGVRGFFCVL